MLSVALFSSISILVVSRRYHANSISFSLCCLADLGA